jgi:hypothetical protein
MPDRFWIYLAVGAAFLFLRVIGWAVKKSRDPGLARLDSAAKRILDSRGSAQPEPEKDSWGRVVKPAKPQGSSGRPSKIPVTAHGQLRKRSSSQAHKQAARVVMTTPSVAVIRTGGRTIAPNTPVVQRRR